MVSVLPSSVVDRGFEPMSSQTNDYKIGMCCFSAKHAPLKRNINYSEAQIQDNVSEWSNIKMVM